MTRGNGTFTAMYFPSGEGGFFVNVSESGPGLTLGAGYDVRLGRNLYLTPNLDVLFQFIGAKNDPVLGRQPGASIIMLFTLGLTWH